jgi:MoxR-like ATPase
VTAGAADGGPGASAADAADAGPSASAAGAAHAAPGAGSQPAKAPPDGAGPPSAGAGCPLPETSRLCSEILAELDQVIVGKRDAVSLVLLGVLAAGHILIEDLPGLGKTLLARSFARVLGLEFTRVQFTPDMLPADLTGAAVLDPGTGQVVFRPGPVFTNLLLADEINRTPPKTQAALLEAMAEAQVSADGRTYPLTQPFVVLATDNPIEYEGTYPLPEAQLDRFTARITLGYLDAAGETEMARRRLARGSAQPQPRQVTDAAALLDMRESLEQVHLDPDVLGYIVGLVGATRSHQKVTVGASPRGTLAVIQMARGHAVLESRDYVTPEDVKAVAVPALAHRLVLRPEMWVRQVSGVDVVGEILAALPVPRAG